MVFSRRIKYCHYYAQLKITLAVNARFYALGLVLMGLLLKFYDPVLAEQTGSKTGFALVAPHSNHRN